MAKENGCESVAFPLIATGTYGFPKDLALRIAISEISNFLFENDMTIYMVVYDKEAFVLSGKLFNDVTELIAENEVVPHDHRISNQSSAPLKERWEKFFRPKPKAKKEEQREELKVKETRPSFSPKAPDENFTLYDIMDDQAESKLMEIDFDLNDFEEMSSAPVEPAAMMTYGVSIDDMIKNKGQTFQEHLFRIIDRKGLRDVDVYKKANIDRKLFSKIKSNVDYSPSKRTVLAFAIALELSLDETLDLLGRAGMTLSRSNEFDIIMKYCLENHITDILEINCILFDYDQPLLGA